MTSEDYDLLLTAGKPFSQVIRVKDAKTIWAELDDFEVRAQLRVDKSRKSALIENLHDFMTKAFDAEDVVITWFMSGEETITLYEKQWGLFKIGYFNLILSDPGTVDERAIVVPTVSVKAVDTTTNPEGEA